MKKKESPSHILLIILLIAHLLFSNYIINQLEDNVINKKTELDLINDKLKNTEMNLINCKSEILNKEIKSIKEDKSEWQEFFITGYTAGSGEQGTNFTLATMFNLKLERVRSLPIIAVDPKVIPLYSLVEIEGLGVFIALDVGGLIKGNRIDILCPNIDTAYDITGEYLVKILKKGMNLKE